MNKFSLKKFFENPLAIIALAYPYLLVVIVGIGLFYISNLGAISQNKLLPIQSDSVVVFKDLTIQEPRIIPGVDLNIIKNASQEMLDKGKQSFATICASCHGNEGKGDGVAGVALNPKPRNFTEENGWKNGRKFVDMYSTLQNGILATGMPQYDYLPADERIAIIHYVRTFMKNIPADSDQDIADLDKKYKLSEGTFQSGQIPVASAMKLIENKYLPKSQKINSTLDKIWQLKGSNSSAELFLSVTKNQLKAITFLYDNTNWSNSTNDFLTIIQKDLNANGFSGKIFSLTNQQVLELHSFLKSII